MEAETDNEFYINIINLSQGTGTLNSSDGSFEIAVKENDTLVFSSLQFQTVKVKITHEIFQEQFLKVRLHELINHLEEVQISDSKLTGNLSHDLAKIEVFNQAEVGFPLRDYKRLSGIDKIYGTLASSPLDLLINAFSGRLKRRKRAIKNIESDRIVDKGMNALPVSFYTTELSIPEDQIFHFVNYCARNESFKRIVVKETPLDLISLYLEQAPGFLEMIKQQRDTIL